jgi:hypothetical protein
MSGSCSDYGAALTFQHTSLRCAVLPALDKFRLVEDQPSWHSASKLWWQADEVVLNTRSDQGRPESHDDQHAYAPPYQHDHRPVQGTHA